MRLSPKRLWVATCVLAVALVATSVLSAPGLHAGAQALYVLVILSTISVFAATARKRPDERAAWLLFAGAFGAVFLGGSAFAIGMGSGLDRAHAVSFVAWAAAPLLLASGLVRLARVRLQGLRVSLWIDAAIIALSAAALDVQLLAHGELRTAAQTYGAIAPLLDLGLLGIAIALVAATGLRADRTWLLMAVGGVSLAIADAVFYRALSDGAPPSSVAPVAGLAIGAVLLSAAALLPRGAAEHPAAADDAAVLTLPGIAALVSLGVLVLGDHSGSGRLAVGLAAAAVIASQMRTGATFAELRGLTQARRLALTDPLTEVANRRRYEHEIEIRLARTETRTVLLTVDLDGFKEVNDTHGHEVGDIVLRAVAARLIRAVRAEDLVARSGGDEFHVLATVAVPTDADALAAHVWSALSAPYTVGALRLQVGGSVGLALYPDDATEPAGLRRAADGAMYAAKRTRSGWSRAPQQQPVVEPAPLRVG